MTVLIVKIATSILVGFFAGPAAVYVFNHMPAGWLTEYGEDPQKDPAHKNTAYPLRISGDHISIQKERNSKSRSF